MNSPTFIINKAKQMEVKKGAYSSRINIQTLGHIIDQKTHTSREQSRPKDKAVQDFTLGLKISNAIITVSYAKTHIFVWC